MKANGKGKIICTRCGSWWPEEIEVCEVCGAYDENTLIELTNEVVFEMLNQMRDYEPSITLDQEEIV